MYASLQLLLMPLDLLLCAASLCMPVHQLLQLRQPRLLLHWCQRAAAWCIHYIGCTAGQFWAPVAGISKTHVQSSEAYKSGVTGCNFTLLWFEWLVIKGYWLSLLARSLCGQSCCLASHACVAPTPTWDGMSAAAQPLGNCGGALCRRTQS